MRNTTFRLLMLLAALVPGTTKSVFAQDTTYVWQSADGDPFNIQAAIVLDSSSSANGSASDVVSLYISDTVDTYSWTPASPGGVQGLWLGTTLAWNPSRILLMDIYTPGYGLDNFDAAFEVVPDGNGEIFDFSTAQPPVPYPGDQSGEWVAASTVPEPSTLQLLLLTVPILIAVRRFATPAARQPRCR